MSASAPLIGFSQMGLLDPIPIPMMTTGDVFFVDSGAAGTGSDALGAGSDPDNPFITLAFALTQCTANNGDFIFLMPGHAETIASSIGIDVAGVSVIGLGSGNDRPTFTTTLTTTQAFEITAASVRLSNIIMSPGGSEGSFIGIFVNTADGVEVDNVEFLQHATFGYAVMVQFTNAADCIFRDSVLNGLDGASGASGLRIRGSSRLIVTRNIIQGNFSAGCIEPLSSACAQVTITHNVLANQSANGTITMFATSTGTLAYNSLSDRHTAIDATVFDPGDCLCNENYVVNAVDEHGIVVPTVASTS